MGVHLVGIAGGSASGKTTLTRLLLALMSSEVADVVELDGYYRAQDGVSREARERVNYDHPNAFEFALLREHLLQLRQGNSIEVPSYDFAAHNRRAGVTRVVFPRRVVIVEGILTFADSVIQELFDTKIFVDAPSEVRLARRLQRDVRERGRSSESVLSQWIETVEPMFVEFCKQTKECADLVVDGLTLSDEAVRGVERFIEGRCCAPGNSSRS